MHCLAVQLSACGYAARECPFACLVACLFSLGLEYVAKCGLLFSSGGGGLGCCCECLTCMLLRKNGGQLGSEREFNSCDVMSLCFQSYILMHAPRGPQPVRGFACSTLNGTFCVLRRVCTKLRACRGDVLVGGCAQVALEGHVGAAVSQWQRSDEDVRQLTKG